MTSTLTDTTTTVNVIKASDLHRVLSDAKPFMSKDRTMPQLCAMQIECTDNNLIAVATDRFTIGVSRADYTGEVFTALLSASTVDNIIRLAKTGRRDANERTVEIEVLSYLSEAGADTVRFNFSTGESVGVTCQTGDFPSWRQLIPAGSNEQQEATVGFDAAKLAQFAKVAGSKDMAVTSRGRGKPAVITIGSDFVGAVMPTRLPDIGYTKPAWV